jgi:hypothetical protein
MSMGRVFTIVLIGGSALYAQRPHGRANAAAPTPAQIAQRDTDRLTRFFTLNTGQQSTVLGILTTAETQLQGITSQIQPLRTTLTSAIKSDNQSLISSTLHQIMNLQEQEEVIRANAAGQIYATVLTTAQQAQVGNGLGPLTGGGQGGGRRGPGGFGPPRANRN